MKSLSNKEKWLLAFISAVTALCLIPLVGMLFAPTTQTTENKVLAEFPSISDNGEPNYDYLSDLGDYYADHFAFRQQLVSIDAAIRGRVFGVSTVDSVVVGRDGWLFYSDTINDFTGKSPMSERQLFNIANNLAITQRYVNDHGAQFLFTIAPNKNTLYPQFMPYTLQAAPAEEHNAIRLAALLDRMDVRYTDMFELFGSRDEVLYLERDSHWSNDGALLAANRLLSDVSRSDAVYADLECTENSEYIGDLNSMLYPLNSVPESNSEYTLEGYEITNGAQAADAPIIITSCSDAAGSLLMYRDSFGNTLYPFMAQAFNAACFVRMVPYNIGMYMDLYQPDTVIIEKVERSIDELASKPPVLESADTDLLIDAEQPTESLVLVSEAQENIMFWRFDGHIEPDVMDEQSRVFLRVTHDDGYSFIREAFTTSDQSGDNGFVMYLSKDGTYGSNSRVDVIVSMNGRWTVVCGTDISWEDIPSAFEE